MIRFLKRLSIRHLLSHLPERAYRDLWLFFVTGLVLFALSTQHGQLNEIRQGRIVATNINCGITQATLQTNKRVIEGAILQQTPAQERALERLGFGTKAEREAQAKKHGEAYLTSVQSSVELFAPNATRVIDVRTGKVNCERLRQLGKTK